jgi:hypothetical protein
MLATSIHCLYHMDQVCSAWFRDVWAVSGAEMVFCNVLMVQLGKDERGSLTMFNTPLLLLHDMGHWTAGL